jgi:hypothetical protein
MKFALINQSKADAKAFPLLAEGMKKFLDPFCADWGLAACEVLSMPTAAAAPPDCVSCVIVDHAGADDGTGWHNRDENGNSIIKGFLDAIPNGELFRGPDGDGSSLLGLLQHEAAETTIDRFVNFFVDLDVTDPASGKTYRSVALEVCDPVQELAESITLSDGTTADLSDYLTPWWFDPAGDGRKLNRMNTLRAAGAIAPGGYAIVRESFSERSHVYAKTLRLDNHVRKMAAWRERLKTRSTSRTARRLREARRAC